MKKNNEQIVIGYKIIYSELNKKRTADGINKLDSLEFDLFYINLFQLYIRNFMLLWLQ